jgi:hypothetical protein
VLPLGQPELSAAHISRYTELGVQQCFCAYYACKATAVLARLIDEASRQVLPENSAVDLVLYDDAFEALNPHIYQHFVKDNLTLGVGMKHVPIQGSYLRIVVPVAEGPTEDDAAASVERFAALLSLLHGESVATERHFAATCDVSTGQLTMTTEPIKPRQTAETEWLNHGLATIMDETDSRDLVHNSTALELLRRSHHERDATLKFLFVWLAVEATLGNGTDRRKFALEVMKSESLNEIINDLRDKRNMLLHDGVLVDFDQKEYLRIKCVLVMGMSRNHGLRERLLQYLKEELAKD